MKKLLAGLFIFSTMLLGTKAFGMGFSEGLSQSKPMAVLIYADWADNVQAIVTAFQLQSQQVGDKYNFVTLNIADKAAKEFNARYHIYPNLPYVLLFKNNGKISRYVQKDCVLNSSCFAEKIKNFAN